MGGRRPRVSSGHSSLVELLLSHQRHVRLGSGHTGGVEGKPHGIGDAGETGESSP